MIIVMFFSNTQRTARKFLIGWYVSADEPVGHPLKRYSKMYSRAIG
jgi:hypothetical protein